ncbi:3-oxoacyl-ACP synthase [Actinoalloteichus sp. AHMU CJ021]|uniref:hypothetical protein n=1 Tax=Actinoalloteichus TaxID=65496 RepID=UPI00037AC61A|nr:hypothetical protein [Actinoalloteichus spitiensis]AUS81296.1 3-oxoacyl-ACP synthase [Actinoalloteichus sp. AHMU CJ021]WIW78600.1 CgpP [Actinoalloteichus caeruleus]
MTGDQHAQRPPVTLGPLGTWFPGTSVEVTDLPELADLPPARRQHALSLGIDRVHDAGDLSEVDLAERAARDALTRTGIGPDQVDVLLYVQGRAPEYLLSSEATRLQARLGTHAALTVGVGELGCVSVSAAFTLAAALLRGDPRHRRVLVVTAGKAATTARYRAPMTILGDGAAAVVVSRETTGRYHLVDHELRSDGRYSDLFRINYRDRPQPQWAEECADEATYSFRLAVESRNRFTETNAAVLDRNGIPVSALGAVLMQNLAVGAFRFWEEALDLPIDPVCADNLAGHGHLGSLDVLLNLEAKAASLAPGTPVLVMNSSPVAAWSSALFRRAVDSDQREAGLR